jgi:type IV secretory pathway TraG/TraD family ATPase VirD4
MVGQTTVRHAHRTTSNGGASVSEPEVARPLLTPDEASRLGAREELIFTNGQPVIRATKIRFYNDRFFKQLARPAPAKSDRIEHVEAVGHVAEITRDEAQPEPDLSEVVNGDEQRPSFLKSAEGKPNGSTDADQHDPKGRLL